MSSNYSGPDEYRPLSPWAYWGLQILFAVPVIGLIFLIIFSINGSNVNRRSFARSYWCSLIMALIVIIAVIATAAFVPGVWEAVRPLLQNIPQI